MLTGSIMTSGLLLMHHIVLLAGTICAISVHVIIRLAISLKALIGTLLAKVFLVLMVDVAHFSIGVVRGGVALPTGGILGVSSLLPRLVCLSLIATHARLLVLLLLWVWLPRRREGILVLLHAIDSFALLKHPRVNVFEALDPVLEVLMLLQISCGHAQNSPNVLHFVILISPVFLLLLLLVGELVAYLAATTLLILCKLVFQQRQVLVHELQHVHALILLNLTA